MLYVANEKERIELQSEYFSFKKDKLYRNSNMITIACKNCEEDWQEKDMCYVIGLVDKNQSIRSLCFIYGDCYCAILIEYTFRI